jgi:hypothetical protein
MRKILPLLLAFFTATALSAADSVPLFNATLTIGKEHRFVLANATGKTSGFLRIGESFEGHKIKAYDAKSGVLEVERDGKTVKLTIVGDAATVNAPSATRATLADANAVLQAMNFEQMLDKTLAGLGKQQGDAMGQMTNRMLPPGADEETKAAVVAFQKKIMEEMMGGMTGANLKDDVAKIYSEVFTKEELADMGAFYQSPIGKVFSDKQPELTEKMNGVMMTRMMANMPKVQQRMQEFGKEMQAKKKAAQAPKQ